MNEWTVEKSETSGWYIAFRKGKGAFIDNELTARAIARYHNASIAAERGRFMQAYRDATAKALADMQQRAKA